MTRTGYSCESMRRKNKHGCSAATEHYCSETGKRVDPMSCSNGCDNFRPLFNKWWRVKKDDEVAIL